MDGEYWEQRENSKKGKKSGYIPNSWKTFTGSVPKECLQRFSAYLP